MRSPSFTEQDQQPGHAGPRLGDGVDGVGARRDRAGAAAVADAGGQEQQRDDHDQAVHERRRADDAAGVGIAQQGVGGGDEQVDAEAAGHPCERRGHAGEWVAADETATNLRMSDEISPDASDTPTPIITMRMIPIAVKPMKLRTNDVNRKRMPSTDSRLSTSTVSVTTS
jgi:hypothetical protein